MSGNCADDSKKFDKQYKVNVNCDPGIFARELHKIWKEFVLFKRLVSNSTSGTSGEDGTSGTSGIDGTNGSSGASGTSGTSGTDGSVGSSGTSGVTGSSGNSGSSGTSGVTGTTGTSGTSGTSGSSSSSGTSGASNVVIGEQRSSTPYDQQLYDAFPSYAWNEDRSVIWQAIRSGDTHADDGPLMYNYTLDGGSTWSDPVQLDVGGLVEGGRLEIGYSLGRLVVAYSVGTSYTDVIFAYSDDDGATWTSAGTVAATVSQDKIVVYGKILRLPSGKLIVPCYTWNDGTDNTTSALLQSTDNGVSWSQFSTILSTTASGSFPQGAISETYVEIAIEGISDATTSLVALARSDRYPTYHLQAKSTDGGATWTNQSTAEFAFAATNETGLPGSTGGFGIPATMIREGDYMYAFMGRRGENSNEAEADDSLRVWKAKVSDILSGTNNWGEYTTIYRALTAYKGSETDWGYTRPFFTQTQELKVGVYDMSYQNRTTIDGVSKRERIVVLPVRGLNAYEAYSITNQSITSGTETNVTTDYKWIDTENVGKKIPTDGWYYVEGTVTFDVSALGTYRWVKLQMVDTGHETGLGDTHSYQLIDKKVIQPSTDSEYNLVRVSGVIYGYSGMEVRFTVKHDIGSPLNLINTSREGRSTLRFKKIE